jgi:DNA-binding HxlR family transcriptional regulator/putative sterol carrier protein
MRARGYGSYCGIAHALELVGERWSLLLVRDLILGPKRFTELRRGLPRIPSNVLAARLRELEDAGVVQRRLLPRPASGVVYELTDYGRELEDILLRLGVWGARSLADPRPDDIVTTDSVQLALRATFHPEAACGLHASFQLALGGVVVHARVDDGRLEVGDGPLPGADLVLEADPRFRMLLTGELAPADALASGGLRATGDLALVDRFFELFSLPRPAPALAA